MVSPAIFATAGHCRPKIGTPQIVNEHSRTIISVSPSDRRGPAVTQSSRMTWIITRRRVDHARRVGACRHIDRRWEVQRYIGALPGENRVANALRCHRMMVPDGGKEVYDPVRRNSPSEPSVADVPKPVGQMMARPSGPYPMSALHEDGDAGRPGEDHRTGHFRIAGQEDHIGRMPIQAQLCKR